MAAGIEAPANDAAMLFKTNDSDLDASFELINSSTLG